MKYILALVLALLAPAAFAQQQLTIPEGQAVALVGPITQASAAQVVDKIHELNNGTDVDPIYIVINSPGGDVLAGFQVIQAIEASRRPVYTVDVGFAASMAAAIHSYGAKRYMTPYAVLMYHEMSSSPGEDVQLSHLLSVLRFERAFEQLANQHLSAVSGVSVNEIEEREATEWWVLADEAAKRHLVDGVVRVPNYPTHPGE